MDEQKQQNEFKTIRNVVSTVIGYRIPPDGYDHIFKTLEQRGELMDKNLSLILAIIKYLDRKEKETAQPQKTQ